MRVAGYAIAERLCSEGARVVVSSRKAANVDRTVGDLAKRGFQVIGVPCHVRCALRPLIASSEEAAAR